MQLRYSFRLYPAPGQRRALARAFGCARTVYNDALRSREAARMEGLAFPSSGELSKRVITEAKRTPERAWLGEVSAVVLQQALRDLEAAYRNFFDGLAGRRPKTGPPRYRSRKDARQAVRFTANARWHITPGGRLRLPKIGDVPVRWSRRLPSGPVVGDGGQGRGGPVLRVVRRGDLRHPAARDRPDGRDRPGVDALRGPVGRCEGRLAAFPAAGGEEAEEGPAGAVRKRKGSANRAKARMRVARAHVKVADARRDFHHQLSARLVRENQAVAVEDLAVKGLARSRLAKSVHDAGWSSFTAMLEYKAARYGRTLVRIGRFEPTSQVCSACGVKDGPKPLHVREWTCGACGAVLDRDVNAALNVAQAAG